MHKLVKKILVGVMTATMALGSVTTAFAATSPVKPVAKPVSKSNVKDTKGSTVSTSKYGYARLKSVKKTSAKTVTVSKKVKVGKVYYTVTKIDAYSFKNASKATKVNLPSTITTINSKAFSGAKSLKTIVVTSKKAPSVSKTAFKGLNTKKMTIAVKKTMSKSQQKTFKARLKKAGYKGKFKVVK